MLSFLKLDTIRGRIRFYVMLVVCIPSIIAGLFFFFFQREQIIEAEKVLISEDLNKNKNTVNGYINVCFEDVNFLIRIVKSHRSDIPHASQEFEGSSGFSVGNPCQELAG